MKNSLPDFERRRLISGLETHLAWSRRRAVRDPQAFRDSLFLDDRRDQRLADAIQPWQQRDFAALDPAWKSLAGLEVDSRLIQRGYIERPRGHSKTTDIASQITWILLAARRPIIGLAAAADRDQADLIHQAIGRLIRFNRPLCDDLELIQHRVRNPETGSRLDVISSDVRSSFGMLPDFVVCDELCHWEKPDLWYSLLSSSAKKPHCLLTVLTNAGVGRGWQWEVREHARASNAWHFSSLEGPQAPWITDDWLAEQRSLLPEPVFERLWLNVWQHSDGEFVTLAEAEACRDDSLTYQLQGRPGLAYVAAVDYAEKHDYTVGCVCHREGERIIVDRMDVVKPSPLAPTPVHWVDDWIEDVASRFHRVRFVLDEYQLLGTIQRLGARYFIERFSFAGGDGNQRLAIQLRRLIVHRQLGWYPGCGRVDGPARRDDLETELASLLVRQTPSGRLRIDHHQDGIHHDDRAFTLGAACLAMLEGTDSPFIEVTLPRQAGEFAW